MEDSHTGLELHEGDFHFFFICFALKTLGILIWNNLNNLMQSLLLAENYMVAYFSHILAQASLKFSST